MVNINLMLSIPMSFKCGQCDVELDATPDPRKPGVAILTCKNCGLKVRAAQGAPGKIGPGSSLKMPEFRPRPKT